MNLLFVCSRNRLRSPTAERLFWGRPLLELRSAGTERDADNPLSGDDVTWADLILVMERRHRKRVQSLFPFESRQKRIVVLGILDDYAFMQTELVELLEHKVAPYLPHEVTNHET